MGKKFAIWVVEGVVLTALAIIFEHLVNFEAAVGTFVFGILLLLVLHNHDRLKETTRRRPVASLSAFIIIPAIVGLCFWLWIMMRTDHPAPKTQLEPKIPSLVFVFGAPLGDNDSSTWIMMLKHFGPDSAHNCTVGFFDDDRKNIEHEWLVKHPDTPFLPPGQFDASQRSLYVAEAEPEGGPSGNFTWTPLDPDRQHYTVSISCREGVFEEKWEVTRVDGVLRAKIVIEHGPAWIEKNPNLERVVFKCEDREFTSTPLLAAVPNLTPRKVHPGWKPNHRFEVPVAIIDPNGNMQIVSGVKLPDGSTATDFGCWNILTKHFGDSPSTQL